MINPPSTHFSWKDLFWLVKKKRDPFMRDCLLGHELNYLAHVVSFNTQEVLRHVVCLFIKNTCNVSSFGSKQSTILIFKIGFPVASSLVSTMFTQTAFVASRFQNPAEWKISQQITAFQNRPMAGLLYVPFCLFSYQYHV